MKRAIKILAILMLFCPLVIMAQNDLPRDGDNILNKNIDKFTGTWYWSNGAESLQLIFKKENILLPLGENIRADVLYGFHKYVKNGVTVEDSTPFKNTVYGDKKYTLSGMGDKEKVNELRGGIDHTSKNKSIKFKIEYIDAAHIKLVKLKNYEGIKVIIPGEPPYDPSITLPQGIILTRKK